jgi:hypothetical protein
MTRARTLKSNIRARMSKTGERYTTARRQVLAASAPKTAAPSSPAAAATRTPDRASPVAEARIFERTGHPLAHWFLVLDRFGALEKGHTLTARHLRDEHGVDGWYSQSITLAYERAHGRRAVNQRVDGVFAFGASKIVAAPVVAVRSAFTASKQRARWTADLDPDLVRALAAGVDGKSSRGFVPRSQGQTSCRFPWGTSVVEVLLTPRPDGRTQVHVDHRKLASREDVERHRLLWRPALTALAVVITPKAAATRRRVVKSR